MSIAKKWNHTKETYFKLKNCNHRQGQAHAIATQVDERSNGDVSFYDQPKKATQGQIDDMAILQEKKSRNWKLCLHLHPWLTPLSILLY